MPARKNRPGKHGTPQKWDAALTRKDRKQRQRYDNALIVHLRSKENERPHRWHYLPTEDRDSARRLEARGLIELNDGADACRVKGQFRDLYMGGKSTEKIDAPDPWDYGNGGGW